MVLRVEDVALLVGEDVHDEYGRVIGVLASFSSNVDGEVEYVEVKIADRGLERIPGERARIRAGKLVVTPEWKHRAVRIIEALDRAYKRMSALDQLASGEIPGSVVEAMKRRLEEQVKKLRVEAEKSLEEIARRLEQIEDESLHVASAIAQIQMVYFSGELADKNYQQGIAHLRRIKQSLQQEKADAKQVMERLDKTLKALTGHKPKLPEKHPAPAPAAHPAPSPAPPARPAVQESVLSVKIED